MKLVVNYTRMQEEASQSFSLGVAGFASVGSAAARSARTVWTPLPCLNTVTAWQANNLQVRCTVKAYSGDSSGPSDGRSYLLNEHEIFTITR